MLRYKENFQRAMTIIVDHGTEAKRRLFGHHLQKLNTSLRQFLQANRHDIYHKFILKRCCQCDGNYKLSKTKILNVSQMELLFEKHGRINGHIKGHTTGQFCCRDIQGAIRIEDFDLTLLNFVLTNFCINLYLESCLQNNTKIKTFEDLLNEEKHTLYHLWKTKQCCIPGCRFVSNKPVLTDQQWRSLYDPIATKCTDVCAYQAKAGIGLSCVDTDLKILIFSYVSQLKMSADAIVEMRNTLFHAPEAELSDYAFDALYSTCKTNILKIYKHCGLDTIEIESKMEYIKHSKYNESLYKEMQILLLKESNQANEIHENVEKLQRQINEMHAQFDKMLCEVMKGLEDKKQCSQTESTTEHFPEKQKNGESFVGVIAAAVIRWGLEFCMSVFGSFCKQLLRINEECNSNDSQGSSAHSSNDWSQIYEEAFSDTVKQRLTISSGSKKK